MTRTIKSSLTANQAVVGAVEEIQCSVRQGYLPDVDAGLQEIAVQHDTSLESVQELFSSTLDFVNTVTVFYSEEGWSAREKCFDYRVDGQMIPRGSVVIGFITLNGVGVVDPPEFLEKEQKEDFEQVMGEILLELGLTKHQWFLQTGGYNLMEWVVQEM